MIITIVTVMLLLSLAGGASYAIFSAQQAVSIENAIQTNANKGQEAVDTILKNTLYVEDHGVYAPPQGEVSAEGWMTLPSWMGEKAYSYSGLPFLYCPFSNNSTVVTPVAVTLPDSTSYNVGVGTYSAGNNRDYVLSSSYQKDYLIAAVVSPLGNDRSMPSCQDIVKKNGRYVVDGGQVWTVDIIDMVNYAGDVTGYASVYVTAADTAAGTPPDPGEIYSRSLVDNINKFKNKGSYLRRMKIYLQSGDYIIDDNTLFQMADESMKTLVLLGDNTSPPIIRSSDGTPLNVYMPDAGLNFEHIDFRGDIRGDGNVIKLNNMTLDGIDASRAEIRAIDLTLTNDTPTTLDLSLSKFVAEGTLTVNGGIRATDSSEIDLIGTTASMASLADSAKVKLTDNSIMTMVNSTLVMDNATLSQYAINNASGVLAVNSSTINVVGSYTNIIENTGDIISRAGKFNLSGSATNGIYSNNGSRINLINTNLFDTSTSTNIPSTGIEDGGGTSTLTGSGSSLSSSVACWSGNIFFDTTLLSSVKQTNDVLNVGNHSDWTCI